MSQLADNPDLMLEVLAKLVHKAGGYVKVSAKDHPSGPFNLASRFVPDGIELRLLGYEERVQ